MHGCFMSMGAEFATGSDSGIAMAKIKMVAIQICIFLFFKFLLSPFI
jgi:hypothetical protein